MGKKLYLTSAAKELGIASTYLRRMARSGEIPALMSGNRYIFDIEQCEQYLSEKAMKNLQIVEEAAGLYKCIRKIKE